MYLLLNFQETYVITYEYINNIYLHLRFLVFKQNKKEKKITVYFFYITIKLYF
jgi:hypothetical protein